MAPADLVVGDTYRVNNRGWRNNVVVYWGKLEVRGVVKHIFSQDRRKHIFHALSPKSVEPMKEDKR